MDISYFNPRAQSEADLLANFIARQSTLDFFLRQLQLTKVDRAANHYLVVAPRGYGKTSLLRRIAIAVRNDSDLRQRFIPLSFREEQHNVISLDVFWRNCLQSLLEAREDEGAPKDEIDVLDAAWDRFLPRKGLKREEQDGIPAWEEFRSHCERLQRRPLLLIDNLDSLLAGLETNQQWALRATLQRDDGPVLIAAASRYPESTHDRQAAFFDFFRIHTLDRLSDTEVMHCLRRMATRRGEAGRVVLNLLDRDPGRIVALNTLAGGNPRTLSVLYSVLESHLSTDILSQLSAMLDTFTGWYQARTEELPLQARAVFDALALNWDPISAARLAEITGLETTAVSSQLSRLEKAGYAEAVSLNRSGTGRNAYQVSERFFNIWYLMRNGPRRVQQSIQFLTKFLQSCFSTEERQSIAQRLLDNGSLRERLIGHARMQASGDEGNKEYAVTIQQLLNTVDCAGENDTQTMDESVTELSPEAIDQLIKQLSLDAGAENAVPLATAFINKGITLAKLGRSEEAVAAYDDVVARFGDVGEPALRERVAKALLYKGNLLLDFCGDPSGAVTAYESGLSFNAPGFQELFHASLAYALALHGGDPVKVREHIGAALAGSAIFPAGRHLLGALAGVNEERWRRLDHIFTHIDLALQADDPKLWPNYLDELQSLLWFVIARGDGEEFRRRMEEARYPQRYAPLYHAFVAAINTEDHLLKINPETRQMAVRIHVGIAHRIRRGALRGAGGQPDVP